MHSLDKLISILRVFPLKHTTLNENSTLNESINLFGSLMLQRVRSLLVDYFPNSDLGGLSEKSSLGEILLALNKNCELDNQNNSFEKTSDNIRSANVSPQSQSVLPTNATKNQIVSVGIDIESIHAFPSDVMLPSGAPFRSRTFCPKEIAYASTKHSPIQTLLGIFCAKEAVIKCCTGANIPTFRDIEITYNSGGGPVCNVRNHIGFDFNVSISHSSDYACAFALIAYSGS